MDALFFCRCFNFWHICITRGIFPSASTPVREQNNNGNGDSAEFKCDNVDDGDGDDDDDTDDDEMTMMIVMMLLLLMMTMMMMTTTMMMMMMSCVYTTRNLFVNSQANFRNEMMLVT